MPIREYTYVCFYNISFKFLLKLFIKKICSSIFFQFSTDILTSRVAHKLLLVKVWIICKFCCFENGFIWKWAHILGIFINLQRYIVFLWERTFTAITFHHNMDCARATYYLLPYSTLDHCSHSLLFISKKNYFLWHFPPHF